MACADGQRVGCAVAEANDVDAIAEHGIGLPELVPTDSRAGFLNFAYVAPGYRGRGTHSAMVRTRVRSLASDADRFR